MLAGSFVLRLVAKLKKDFRKEVLIVELLTGFEPVTPSLPTQLAYHKNHN